MGLAGALSVAPTVQSIELLDKGLINVARKGVLEGTWFDTRVDRYGSGRLSSNCCLYECSSNGTRLLDPTR